jgi:hypothetical protein
MGSSKRGSGRAVKSSRSEVGIQGHNALWRVTLRQERAQPSTSALRVRYPRGVMTFLNGA